MNLSNLKPAKGSTRQRKRVGRGHGSTRGGTSTRGHKGQKSRSGASIPAWFEGGQMPLMRRIPKFGFKNRNRVSYKPLNLTRLIQLVEEGQLDPTSPITPEMLVTIGVIKKKDRVKVLGNGDITTALQISAHAFSASAEQKIESAGGTATVV